MRVCPFGSRMSFIFSPPGSLLFIDILVRVHVGQAVIKHVVVIKPERRRGSRARDKDRFTYDLAFDWLKCLLL